MSKQNCEDCKYSYQYGNPLWNGNELKCRKHYDIPWVSLDRVVRKKECKDYETK